MGQGEAGVLLCVFDQWNVHGRKSVPLWVEVPSVVLLDKLSDFLAFTLSSRRHWRQLYSLLCYFVEIAFVGVSNVVEGQISRPQVCEKSPETKFK